MSRRDGYKVSGVLVGRPSQAEAAPLEFPAAPAGPVVLQIPPTPTPAPAPAPASVSTPAPKQHAASNVSNTDAPQPAEWELVDGVVHELDPDLFDDSPFQPSGEEGDRYDPVGISQLAQAFSTAGQGSPILARRKENGRYEIIAGHRRIRAARLIRARIKVILCTMTDREARLAVMKDNAGVKAKSDYQKAKLYQCALNEKYATTHEEVAAIFATNYSSVSRRLKMLRLPAPILALLDETPALFGTTTSGVLHTLIEEHPEHVDIITQAAARLKEPGVAENSIKSWVAQMIAAATSSPTSNDDERAQTRIITDRKKRSLYTARLRGRVITIRLNSTAVDPMQALDRLAEVLETDPKLVASDGEN